MPFIKDLHKDFEIIDNQICLSKEYMKANAWRFKKITGTRLASICNIGDFASPLKTWCEMVGIYKEEMPEVLSCTGTIIEPRVRDFVAKQLKIKFKDYDPKLIHYDVFHLDDPKAEAERVFGGIPDGEACDEKGNIIYDKKHPILEVKTMSIDKFSYSNVNGEFKLKVSDLGYPIVSVPNLGRLKHFKNGTFEVPLNYQYQLGLYLYLRKAQYGLFAVCFLKTEDYKTPDSVNVNNREIRLVTFKNNPDIKHACEEAEIWYKKYIKGGVSPQLTEKDKEWLKAVGLIK